MSESSTSVTGAALGGAPGGVATAAAPAWSRARAMSGRGVAFRQWSLLVLWTACLVAFVLIPVGLLHPFRAQTPLEVGLAYEMRRWAPLFTTLGLLPIAGLIYLRVRDQRVRWRLIPIVLLVALAGAATWFARQNHFEWMFEPLPAAVFVRASEAKFPASGDMVIAVETATDSVAYPVLEMAYHHLVMDNVGGVPVVATYCTLCHTGLVWKRTLDGRVLTFRLYGINNQNMLMRDDQTGSWWQQATGVAIQGPLRGRKLEPVLHDEITFAIFRRERPGGRVLRPGPGFEDAYAPANWERRMKRRPTVTPKVGGDAWPPRTHVLGIEAGGRAKAYPFPSIREGGPVNDVVGGVAVIVVVAEDLKSARVFERTVGGRRLEFFAKVGTGPIVLTDVETGSEWDFTGTCTQGPLAGTTLQRVLSSKEYLFDWRLHRPQTTMFARPAAVVTPS